MVGFDGTGAWSRIAPSGRSTGSCLLANGTVVNTEPGQSRVNGDCSVTGESQNGVIAFSAQIQAGKRGIIGRVFALRRQTLLRRLVRGGKRG